MKVLLINTPRSPYNAILDHASETSRRFIHKKLIGPPLGLLTIAAALEDHDVSLLETKAAYDLMEQQGLKTLPSLHQLVLDQLEKSAPDMVGVTFIASEHAYGLEIFDAVKAHDPNILTIAGGLHTTLCPEDFRHPAVDIVCPGESVKKVRSIARAFDEKRPYTTVPGIYLNGKSGWQFTPVWSRLRACWADCAWKRCAVCRVISGSRTRIGHR